MPVGACWQNASHRSRARNMWVHGMAGHDRSGRDADDCQTVGASGRWCQGQPRSSRSLICGPARRAAPTDAVKLIAAAAPDHKSFAAIHAAVRSTHEAGRRSWGQAGPQDSASGPSRCIAAMGNSDLGLSAGGQGADVRGPGRATAYFSLIAKCLRTGSSMVQVPLKPGSTTKASPGESVTCSPSSGVIVIRPSIRWTNS